MTAPTKRRVEGVTTHRARSIEATTHRGIPITTVPRTLVDLAATSPSMPSQEPATRPGSSTTRRRARSKRCWRGGPNAKGAAKLRDGPPRRRPRDAQQARARFLSRLEEAGLPLPKTNKPAHGRRVDCRWPDHRLTVELDSYRYHRSRHAWEQDRRREREARARGDEFRRYTYGDVFESPRLMLAELRALLP